MTESRTRTTRTASRFATRDFTFLTLSDYPTFETSSFSRPCDAAVEPTTNRVFVTDYYADCVHVFDSRTGGHLFQFGSTGSDNGQFNQPSSVVISESGLVHVSDNKNHRIQVFDKDGKFVRTFGCEGREPGQLENPLGMAVDHKRREIYVAENWNHRVSVFSEDGAFLRWIGSGVEGTDLGDLKNPTSVGVDEDRNVVFVCDQHSARVSIFSALDGSFVGTLGHDDGEPKGRFGSGFKVVSVSKMTDHVVVIDNAAHNESLQVFKRSTGEFVNRVEGFDVVWGVSFGPRNELLVCCKPHGQGPQVQRI